ncbi:uncharacterized protein LOC116601507 isoform X2 [Nematostella vectensis]|uniref:uncharacterized protein LOC116601507 isoform X2 n=1 Tax=Nematostella vectensis TaxID=45351 RepID=UPI002076E8BA|nr:uncharacterized protein LOC116601507 isoform X2 [Nematostella vectensis]
MLLQCQTIMAAMGRTLVVWLLCLQLTSLTVGILVTSTHEHTMTERIQDISSVVQPDIQMEEYNLDDLGRRIECFCNGPRCSLGVCKSQHGCYIKAHMAAHVASRTDAHAQNNNVTYGCVENLRPSHICVTGAKSRRTPNVHYYCCEDGDLCNMPLYLKDIITNQEKNRIKKHYEKNKKGAKICTEHTPALRLASVIIPSILIGVVGAISIALSCELVRYRKLFPHVRKFPNIRKPSVTIKRNKDHKTVQASTNSLDSLSCETTVEELLEDHEALPASDVIHSANYISSKDWLAHV